MREARILSQIRDALLPKLIFGTLRVDNFHEVDSVHKDTCEPPPSHLGRPSYVRHWD
jgi:hypothetical protein